MRLNWGCPLAAKIYSAYVAEKRRIQDSEEKAFLEIELAKWQGNVTDMARALKIDRPNLLRIFRRLKVERSKPGV